MRADSTFPERLRGFTGPGLLAILVVVAATLLAPLFGALFVLLWAGWSRTPWADLGFARPRSGWVTALGGILFGILFKLAMKAIVLPLFHVPVINPAYHFLVGNTAALPGLALTILFGAAFGEETVFRGWAFERLGRLVGSGPAATAVIVVLTSVLFAAGHLHDQGTAGALQAGIVGLVFASVFAATRRLWFLMAAHAAFDLTAVAIIYLDLEAKVAHLIFR